MFLGRNVRNVYQVPEEKEPAYSGLKRKQGRRLLQERWRRPYVVLRKNQNGAMGQQTKLLRGKHSSEYNVRRSLTKDPLRRFELEARV